jgi:hypothetical protein
MYVIAIAIAEFILFLHFIPWYVSLCLLLIYSLWYFDGKEYTGERRWDALRSLRLWHWLSPVQCIFPNKADISQTKGKRLFVLPTCLTPSPVIWGIGLHGGVLAFNQPIHYLVPPVYMWIPILRDILMWTGAVTYSLSDPRYNKHDVLQELLDNGRVVAYSPSNFFNPHQSDLEANIEHRYPHDDMLRYCMAQSVNIIPIVVHGERERYYIVQKYALLQKVQAWFYQRLDYALPFCYWFRLFNKNRPPLVMLKIGPSLTCNLYQTQPDGLEKLRKALVDVVVELAEPVRVEISTKGEKNI